MAQFTCLKGLYVLNGMSPLVQWKKAHASMDITYTTGCMQWYNAQLQLNCKKIKYTGNS